jgi:uncharacterized integral membrane protein
VVGTASTGVIVVAVASAVVSALLAGLACLVPIAFLRRAVAAQILSSE